MQSSSCISVPLRTSPGLPIALQENSASVSLPTYNLHFSMQGGAPSHCCSPAGILLFVLPTCSEDSPAVSVNTVLYVECVCLCVLCVCACASRAPASAPEAFR